MVLPLPRRSSPGARNGHVDAMVMDRVEIWLPILYQGREALIGDQGDAGRKRPASAEPQGAGKGGCAQWHPEQSHQHLPPRQS